MGRVGGTRSVDPWRYLMRCTETDDATADSELGLALGHPPGPRAPARRVSGRARAAHDVLRVPRPQRGTENGQARSTHGKDGVLALPPDALLRVARCSAHA
eukprot:6611884-Prymnesium_polylepis.1